jgi:hypothetical protein
MEPHEAAKNPFAAQTPVITTLPDQVTAKLLDDADIKLSIPDFKLGKDALDLPHAFYNIKMDMNGNTCVYHPVEICGAKFTATLTDMYTDGPARE